MLLRRCDIREDYKDALAMAFWSREVYRNGSVTSFDITHHADEGGG